MRSFPHPRPEPAAAPSVASQQSPRPSHFTCPQQTSVSETLSTLNFGKNVTEITLGAAKKNAESGVAWEAKERAMKMEREAAGVSTGWSTAVFMWASGTQQRGLPGMALAGICEQELTICPAVNPAALPCSRTACVGG